MCHIKEIGLYMWMWHVVLQFNVLHGNYTSHINLLHYKVHIFCLHISCCLILDIFKFDAQKTQKVMGHVHMKHHGYKYVAKNIQWSPARQTSKWISTSVARGDSMNEEPFCLHVVIDKHNYEVISSVQHLFLYSKFNIYVYSFTYLRGHVESLTFFVTKSNSPSSYFNLCDIMYIMYQL